MSPSQASPMAAGSSPPFPRLQVGGHAGEKRGGFVTPSLSQELVAVLRRVKMNEKGGAVAVDDL